MAHQTMQTIPGTTTDITVCLSSTYPFTPQKAESHTQSQSEFSFDLNIKNTEFSPSTQSLLKFK